MGDQAIAMGVVAEELATSDLSDTACSILDVIIQSWPPNETSCKFFHAGNARMTIMQDIKDF